MWSEVIWNSAQNAVHVLNQRNLRVVKKQLWFLPAKNAVTRSQKLTKTSKPKWRLKLFSILPNNLVAVIGKEEQKLNTLPTARIECPRCGNNTAYVWQVQTRGADESSTQFMRCTKCNYTFREYS